MQGAGGVGDGAFVDVGDPCGVAGYVDVGLGDVPFVVFAGGLFGLDEGDDGFTGESLASVVHVEVGCDERVEFCEFVLAQVGE